MSLFRKLLGRETPSELEARADTLFASGDFGAAKLAYERALERLASGAEERPRLEGRVSAARDGIARQRIVEAARLVGIGSAELARAELDGALEVATDPDVRDEARAALDQLEFRDAVTAATDVELTDEDRRALIVSQWSEAEEGELEPLGEALLTALLAVGSGRVDEGLRTLESLLAEAEGPCFLLRETGLARAASDDLDGAIDAFSRYLAALPSDAADELVLGARHQLAALASSKGDSDAALEHLWAGVEAAPEDVRAYKTLGAVLRQLGRNDEATEVLTTGLETLEGRPDWQLFQELGLAHEGAGRVEQAKQWLERVVSMLKDQRTHDIPPPTAITLARLHEAEGRLDRAADLFRLLAMGSDRARHALYHREAARLLIALELPAEARKMLKRAEALLESDPEGLADVQTQLAALEA
jgi:tetratricopeptide (TPR) repeat protein